MAVYFFKRLGIDMSHRFKKLFLLGLSSLFLTACGGGGDFAPPTGVPEFNGIWVSDCVTDGLSSLINSTTISGTSATFLLKQYSSLDCTGAVSNTTELNSVMVFGADLPFVASVCSNVKEVDFNVSSVSVNGITLPTALISVFIELPTPTIYDLICSERNQLFTGELTAILDGSTAAKRPEFIDHSYPLTKL